MPGGGVWPGRGGVCLGVCLAGGICQRGVCQAVYAMGVCLPDAPQLLWTERQTTLRMVTNKPV